MPWGMIQFLSIFVVVCAVTLLSFTFADQLTHNTDVRGFIETFGLLGTILLGFIGGINPFLPIPPATFSPIFSASGISIAVIIGGYALGTTLADSITYSLGRAGRRISSDRYPELHQRITLFLTYRMPVVLFGALLYFIFVPFPNELLLVPFGLAGYSFRILFPLLLVSNVLHHTILVLGYQQLLNFFAG